MHPETMNDNTSHEKEISRRSFLKALALSGGSVMIGSWVAGCASAPAAVAPSNTKAAVVSSNSLTLDLTLPENKPLASVGGALALDGNALDSVGLLLYRDSETSIQVFSRKCTHLGCAVAVFIKGVATCPCHGSQFDQTGNAVHGPAKQPLKKYAAALRGTQVVVTSA
jgi:cytochrome b6-f complex iron-sulfur subunit